MLFLKSNHKTSRCTNYHEGNQFFRELLKSYNSHSPMFNQDSKRINYLLERDFIQRILKLSYTGFIINNPTEFELEIKENLTRILKDINHDNL